MSKRGGGNGRRVRGYKSVLRLGGTQEARGLVGGIQEQRVGGGGEQLVLPRLITVVV